MTTITVPLHKGKSARVGTKRKPDCMFEVEAEIVGHFAIHRTIVHDLHSDAFRLSDHFFEVTHVPTKGMITRFYFEKNARAFIEEIKDLTDWSITDHKHYEAIRSKMREIIWRTDNDDCDEYVAANEGSDE